MKFAKLMLVSAISLSSSAFAMQSMDDESMSAATGQDGLSLTMTMPSTTFDVILHDTNGFTGATGAGGILLDDINLNGAALNIDVDAGSTGVSANDATLQVKIFNLAPITVNLGTLKVGNSNRDATPTPGWGMSYTSGTIANLGSITIGASSAASPLMNIQMGNAPQGAWIRLAPTLTGGITLNDFALLDTSAVSSGIGVDVLSVVDNGGANLTSVINVNANTGGLVATLSTLGNVTTGIDVRMQKVQLGTVNATPLAANTIGDVEIIGLRMAGSTIGISGHN